MKNLRTSLLCVCISIIGFSAAAQNQDTPALNEPDYNKPKLFAAHPDQIPVNLTNINALLSSSVGNAVDMNVSATTSFRFTGEVISTVSKYQNRIISVVIRSSNFSGAIFSISKITNDNGTISYTGRLISKRFGDVYELKELNGSFVLVKKNYYELINE
ncbi:MAG: hypothetical protein ABL876_02445 [Chitinophagaceae bacterium]